jgi:hypothetical protein
VYFTLFLSLYSPSLFLFALFAEFLVCLDSLFSIALRLFSPSPAY